MPVLSDVKQVMRHRLPGPRRPFGQSPVCAAPRTRKKSTKRIPCQHRLDPNYMSFLVGLGAEQGPQRLKRVSNRPDMSTQQGTQRLKRVSNRPDMSTRAAAARSNLPRGPAPAAPRPGCSRSTRGSAEAGTRTPAAREHPCATLAPARARGALCHAHRRGPDARSAPACPCPAQASRATRGVFQNYSHPTHLCH